MPTRRTSDEEKELIEKAHRYMPAGSLGNFGANLLIREGRGGRGWDVSGNEYVDYLLGSGAMLVGHAHPEVMEALMQAVPGGSKPLSVQLPLPLQVSSTVQATPWSPQADPAAV